MNQPNTIHQEGDVAFLVISRSDGTSVVVTISPEDSERIANFSKHWFALRSPKENTFRVYAKIRKNGRPTNLLLYRFVMNAPEGFDVDHIDGNVLNNTRSNLRITTHAENIQNQKATGRKSLSGIRNVYLHNKTGLWHVCLVLNRRSISGGYFRNVHDAANAAAELRKKHFTHCPENSGHLNAGELEGAAR